MFGSAGGYWRLKGLFFSDNGLGFSQDMVCFSFGKTVVFIGILDGFSNGTLGFSTGYE